MKENEIALKLEEIHRERNSVQIKLDELIKKRAGIEGQILINQTYLDDCGDFRKENEEKFARERRNNLLEELALIDSDIYKLGLKLKQIRI